MTNATKKFHNRIAVAFDFDETLAPGSFETLLESRGINATKFQEERVQPLIDAGWDKQLARFHCLIEESKRHEGAPITVQSLDELGRGLRLYDGVPELFDRITQSAHAIIPDVDVEFYLITSGVVEIARATPIGHYFKKLWGCEFHSGKDGEVEWLKKIVTHTEKTRYLLLISNGLIDHVENNEQVNLFHIAKDDEVSIPLSQMIYVGDGTSDIPAFSLMYAQVLPPSVVDNSASLVWPTSSPLSAFPPLQITCGRAELASPIVV